MKGNCNWFAVVCRTEFTSFGNNDRKFRGLVAHKASASLLFSIEFIRFIHFFTIRFWIFNFTILFESQRRFIFVFKWIDAFEKFSHKMRTDDSLEDWTFMWMLQAYLMLSWSISKTPDAHVQPSRALCSSNKTKTHDRRRLYRNVCRTWRIRVDRFERKRQSSSSGKKCVIGIGI